MQYATSGMQANECSKCSQFFHPHYQNRHINAQHVFALNSMHLKIFTGDPTAIKIYTVFSLSHICYICVSQVQLQKQHALLLCVYKVQINSTIYAATTVIWDIPIFPWFDNN